MNAAAAMFEERAEPGQLLSLALALAVHVLLALVLVFGVRWQNRPPESVTVELWEAPQAAPPPPVVEPKPVPKVEPPPPPPAPTPEPRIEKPDIAEKAPPPKPKPVPKPEVKKQEPKPVARPEPLKPRVTEAEKRMKEELAREQASLALERERLAIAEQLKRESAQASAAASARALDGWTARIRGKIRGNIVLPPDIKGNPEAIFDVVQLPTGEVLSVKLRKSSGHAGYDQAVERAILKSSPLPRADRPEMFLRDLRLTFRPLDPV